MRFTTSLLPAVALVLAGAPALAGEHVDRDNGFRIDVPEGFTLVPGAPGQPLYLKGPEDGAVVCAVAVLAAKAPPLGFVAFCEQSQRLLFGDEAAKGDGPPPARLERDRGRRLVAIAIRAGEAQTSAVHVFYHPQRLIALGGFIKAEASEAAIRKLQQATKSFVLLDDAEAPPLPAPEAWPLDDAVDAGGIRMSLPKGWKPEAGDEQGVLARGPFGVLLRVARLAPGDPEPTFAPKEGVAHPFAVAARGDERIVVVGTCSADTEALWRPTIEAVAAGIEKGIEKGGKGGD